MLAIINGDTLKQYPQLLEPMSMMYQLLDDTTMQSLNYKVVEEGRDRADVAREFLLEHGLVTEEELR